MKTGLILLVAALLCSTKSVAAPENYGTVIFNTRVPGVIDVPIFTLDGPIGAYAPDYHAQLLLVTGEGNTRVLIGLTPMAAFQKPTPSAPALAAYVEPPNDVLLIPGYEPGTRATLVMRVFRGRNYEAWFDFRGESEPFTITLGGTNSAGTVFPDAYLVGFQGVTFLPLTPPCPPLLSSIRQTFFSREYDKLRFDFCFYNEWQRYCMWASNPFPNPTNVFPSAPITNGYYLAASRDLTNWVHFAIGTTTQNIATLHFDPPTNSPIFFRNVRALSVGP